MAKDNLQIRAGVVSRVGNYREHNEDNFYMPSVPASSNSPAGEDREMSLEFPSGDVAVKLFLVADGMGGQLAGEKASQMAVDIIPKELGRRIGAGEMADQVIRKAVRDSVATANHEILGLSVVQTEFSNMGTTVVLALLQGGRIYVAGIGDSRAYLIRNGKIDQLTKDHSLAEALREAGTITREEVPNHKFNNVLYLYLGSKEARGGPDDIFTTDLRSGDRILLASDGLTGVLSDEKLLECMNRHAEPIESARSLTETALGHHSKDNVTCMVIHAR